MARAGHRNARLTLTRLMDHCDFALMLADEAEEEPTVTVNQVRRLILEDFGGDPRSLTPVPALSRCEDVDVDV